MTPLQTRHQLVSVEVSWPLLALPPPPLLQAADGRSLGEAFSQIITWMNLRGIPAWRDSASPQYEQVTLRVRLDDIHEAQFLCRFVTLPLH